MRQILWAKYGTQERIENFDFATNFFYIALRNA